MRRRIVSCLTRFLKNAKSPSPGNDGVYDRGGIKGANMLGYPVLVRPSYVLGGQGMQIAVNDNDIVDFMAIINREVQEHRFL